MDEFVVAPVADPSCPAAEASPDPAAIVASPVRPPKRRLSRWLIVGLVASVALIGGAAFLMSRAGQSHRDAVAQRTTAAAQLKRTRTDTAESQSQLAHTQSVASTEDDSLATGLVTVHQLGQLNDQGTAASSEVLQAGENGIDPDTYNAAIDKSNTLTDLWNSTLDQLNKQIDQLPAT